MPINYLGSVGCLVDVHHAERLLTHKPNNTRILCAIFQMFGKDWSVPICCCKGLAGAERWLKKEERMDNKCQLCQGCGIRKMGVCSLSRERVTTGFCSACPLTSSNREVPSSCIPVIPKDWIATQHWVAWDFLGGSPKMIRFFDTPISRLISAVHLLATWWSTS